MVLAMLVFACCRGDLPEIPPPPGDADAAGDEGAAP